MLPFPCLQVCVRADVDGIETLLLRKRFIKSTIYRLPLDIDNIGVVTYNTLSIDDKDVYMKAQLGKRIYTKGMLRVLRAIARLRRKGDIASFFSTMLRNSLLLLNAFRRENQGTRDSGERHGMARDRDNVLVRGFCDAASSQEEHGLHIPRHLYRLVCV